MAVFTSEKVAGFVGIRNQGRARPSIASLTALASLRGDDHPQVRQATTPGRSPGAFFVAPSTEFKRPIPADRIERTFVIFYPPTGGTAHPVKIQLTDHVRKECKPTNPPKFADVIPRKAATGRPIWAASRRAHFLAALTYINDRFAQNSIEILAVELLLSLTFTPSQPTGGLTCS